MRRRHPLCRRRPTSEPWSWWRSCVIAAIIGFVILKFLSTGALIEGVRRARSNGSMTVREGFREGWAHWGVLFRIALLYALVAAVSFALLSGACVSRLQAFGQPALFVAIGLAVIVGVPWLVTLSMLQAFAERIAVFENRRALDAIRKARLFLHGRLQLGLKLVVASFLGVLLVGALGIVVIAPVVLLVAGIGGGLGHAARGRDRRADGAAGGVRGHRDHWRRWCPRSGRSAIMTQVEQ